MNSSQLPITFVHHIHHRLGGMSWLSWENRLRIAAEAAGALAYLHSETIMPIIHRDVKSTNILLDDNYTAKISDFGASRLVPLDHEQVTTLILGTLGYLDPQYYHTSQLTEKSDVYSFGVVLAELITGKKPIGADRINEEKNLATYFVNSVKENRLYEIVEPRLLREGTLEKLHTLADLVKRCLSLQNQDRPTMKEVAMELDGLKKLTTHPWIPQTSQETTSLVLEVEQSELYDAPLVSYGPNEWDSYSGSRETRCLKKTNHVSVS
ncbi:wall-associated receptor kinase 2-like protein [Tanacetum coccineum]